MNCQNCNKNKTVEILGKVSDCFNAKISEIDHSSPMSHSYEGYVPQELGIGRGDYIEFTYCLNCGQIQGNFPKQDALKPFEITED